MHMMCHTHGGLRLISRIIFIHAKEALHAQHYINVEEEHVWVALKTLCCWDHGGIAASASWEETGKALQKAHTTQLFKALGP